MARPSADLIRGIPMFSELDDSSVSQLADDFMEREFAEGQSLATEGEGGLNFFVVESGSVDVSIGGEVVATLGPGASFGEVALVDKSARSATVTSRSWSIGVRVRTPARVMSQSGASRTGLAAAAGGTLRCRAQIRRRRSVSPT